jgi:hypothetical protein
MTEPVPVDVVTLVQKENPFRPELGIPLTVAISRGGGEKDTGTTTDESIPEIFTGGRKAAAFKAINQEESNGEERRSEQINPHSR